MIEHLVRVGVMGQVGRYNSIGGERWPRGARVICRTGRGLEVGEVLAPLEGRAAGVDGDLLRGVTVEDDLLLARLEKRRERAYAACVRLLEKRGISAALMDVELLFDGQALYFYFLGEVTPELEAITAELTEAYEKKVQLRHFGKLLTEGCGPGCGTEAAAGQGCGTGGACSTCAVGGCGPATK